MSKHTILSFRSLKPVALLIAALGLSPLSSYVQLFSSTGSLKYLPESPSRISRIYGLILGSILTLLNLYNFIEVVSSEREGFPQMLYFYMVVAVLFMFLTFPAIAYTQSCSSKYSRTRSLILYLEKTDQILMKQINLFSNGKGAVEYRHEHGVVAKKILLAIAPCVVMYAMDVYSNHVINLTKVLARTFSHLVVTVVMIEFWAHVELLRDRFSTLNSLLEETLRQQDILESSGTPVHAWIPTDDIHEEDKQYGQRRNCLRVKNIVTLRIVHYRLHNIGKRNVAVVFRANLLVEVVQVFVFLIMSAHILVNNPYETRFSISKIVWFLFTISRFMMVAVICDRLTAEAGRTAKILARPVLMEDQAGEDDESLFRQTILFSRQMTDCGRLRFRVIGGIFVVDVQLLVALLGTTITYLIVLQQL